jgi:large subunit ribosomal protein L24
MVPVRFKRNDPVVVKAGKDKGKTGKVLRVIPETGRVVVEKINFAKHFVRADRGKNVQGGVMEKEAPIHASNIMIYCEECAQGVRVRVKTLQDGTKTRVCSRCAAVIEKAK